MNISVQGTKGLVGASVQVMDARGETVARRDIGGNIGAGSCGPHTATVAVREPGEYKVSVKYADGVILSRDITLGEQRGVAMKMNHPASE